MQAGDAVPKLAANIAYMFTERPLLERVGAAARAGFPAIELQFPYDIAPAVMKSEIAKHGLTVLGLNTERGGADQFGLAAVPGSRPSSRRCSSRRWTISWRSTGARCTA
jgi:2-dehydrotetronate isomerase